MELSSIGVLSHFSEALFASTESTGRDLRRGEEMVVEDTVGRNELSSSPSSGLSYVVRSFSGCIGVPSPRKGVLAINGLSSERFGGVLSFGSAAEVVLLFGFSSDSIVDFCGVSSFCFRVEDGANGGYLS